MCVCYPRNMNGPIAKMDEYGLRIYIEKLQRTIHHLEKKIEFLEDERYLSRKSLGSRGEEE